MRRFSRTAPVAIALLGMSGAAQAACPGPGDLSRGIAVTYEDGTVDTFRRLDAHRVEQMIMDDPPMRDILGQGLYLMRSGDFENGKEIDPLQVDYSMPASDLPVPRADQTVRLTAAEDYKGEVYEYDETYRAGPVKKVTIGGCTLSAIDVKLTRATNESGPSSIEVMRYFPDLGFSLVHGVGDIGQPLELFPVSWIEVVE